MDVVILSRLQFALTIMFHYLFPPLSIGLGVILVIMEGLWLKTRNRRYEAMARFWTRIFAVNFGVGVATGIVMEFEFGTNWATYSRFVGDVFGSALAAEGIFAFFLESGFLAILVFGWDRVGPRMHFFATLMVALGSTFSAVWIVIANSWMHTPAGFEVVGEGLEAKARITDFWAMVFNPSAMHRLGHVYLGCLLQGSFFVTSVAAWYLLRKRHLEFAKTSFKIALGVATVAGFAMLASGHSQAVAVSKNQPVKLAAFEGHFETGPAPLYLVGVPNAETKTVDYGVAIPGMLSVLVHGDADAPVAGLDQVPEEDHPPLVIPFLTYHVMVGIGFALIGLSVVAWLMLWRRRLFETRWLLWTFVGAVVLPIIANQAGWVAAEVGRQPWIVQGLLRTSDAVSKAVRAEEVLASIILFSIIYLFLGALWVFVLNEKIRHGPDDPESLETAGGPPNLFDAASRRTDQGTDDSLTHETASDVEGT